MRQARQASTSPSMPPSTIRASRRRRRTDAPSCRRRRWARPSRRSAACCASESLPPAGPGGGPAANVTRGRAAGWDGVRSRSRSAASSSLSRLSAARRAPDMGRCGGACSSLASVRPRVFAMPVGRLSGRGSGRQQAALRAASSAAEGRRDGGAAAMGASLGATGPRQCAPAVQCPGRQKSSAGSAVGCASHALGAPAPAALPPALTWPAALCSWGHRAMKHDLAPSAGPCRRPAGRRCG